MRTALALLLGACLGVGVAYAVDNTGTDSEFSYEYEQMPDRDCSVYYYPSEQMAEVGRIISLGYSVTVGGDASYGNISQYDVLLMALAAPGSCPYQADIEQFVDEGGGLLIHQPNGLGTVDYAPPGFEFVIADNWWCDPPGANTIVNAGHPIMAGLYDFDLCGRYDSAMTSGLGSGYTLLGEGTGVCTGHVQSAAGTFGCGKVYADVGNWGGSSTPGTDAYLINVFEWLCEGGTPAESTTWGEIKGMFQ